MRALQVAIRVMAVFAAGFLGLMMVLTVLDIFMRFIFDTPIPGAAEAAEYMMVCAVFFSLAWCGRQGRHIEVDLVMSRMPARVQAAAGLATHFMGLIVCAVLSWQTFIEATAQKNAGFSSSSIKVPTYPFYVIEALGYAFLALFIATVLAGRIKELTGHES